MKISKNQKSGLLILAVLVVGVIALAGIIGTFRLGASIYDTKTDGKIDPLDVQYCLRHSTCDFGGDGISLNEEDRLILNRVVRNSMLGNSPLAGTGACSIEQYKKFDSDSTCKISDTELDTIIDSWAINEITSFCQLEVLDYWANSAVIPSCLTTTTTSPYYTTTTSPYYTTTTIWQRQVTTTIQTCPVGGCPKSEIPIIPIVIVLGIIVLGGYLFMRRK